MPTLSRNHIISFVLALAAAGALFAYTSHVRKSAESTTNSVTVIVATHDLALAEAVADATLRLKSGAAASVAGGAGATGASGADRGTSPRLSGSGA